MASAVEPRIPPSRTCYRHWRGTAPFCNGDCLPGERVLGYNDWTSSCGTDTADTHYECDGFTVSECATGNYALCEGECVGTIQQAWSFGGWLGGGVGKGEREVKGRRGSDRRTEESCFFWGS